MRGEQRVLNRGEVKGRRCWSVVEHVLPGLPGRARFEFTSPARTVKAFLSLMDQWSGCA